MLGGAVTQNAFGWVSHTYTLQGFRFYFEKKNSILAICNGLVLFACVVNFSMALYLTLKSCGQCVYWTYIFYKKIIKATQHISFLWVWNIQYDNDYQNQPYTSNFVLLQQYFLPPKVIS